MTPQQEQVIIRMMEDVAQVKRAIVLVLAIAAVALIYGAYLF